jgi:hypothetical protein
MTKFEAQNRPAGSSPADDRLNTVDLMAKDTDTQTTTDTQDTSTTNPPAPGGNPDNRETVQSMDAPELRNAVIELLTIIDDSDDMDVVVTISDDGTVVVEAA